MRNFAIKPSSAGGSILSPVCGPTRDARHTRRDILVEIARLPVFRQWRHVCTAGCYVERHPGECNEAHRHSPDASRQDVRSRTIGVDRTKSDLMAVDTTRTKLPILT